MIQLQNFVISPDWNSVPIKHQLPILPQSLTTTILLYVPMKMTPLDTNYTWNHAVFALLWLAHFPWHNIFKDHPLTPCVKIFFYKAE